MNKKLFACSLLHLVMCSGTAEVIAQQVDNTRTFTEMLEAEEQKRKREQEAMEKSVADRDNRFGAIPDNVDQATRVSYEARVEEFRKTVQALRRIFTQYQLTNEGIEGDKKLVSVWDETYRQSQAAMDAWLQEMVKLYRSDPKRYQNLGLTLMELTRKEGQLDRVELILEAARAVFELPPNELDPPLLETIGYIAYANADFDLAQKAWDQYRSSASLPAIKAAMYANIDNAREAWKAELQYRELDKGRDNPIVELITSKGILKVELFEDQAPESVRNFLYLVENNFYQRMRFFRVVPYFGAQTGCKIGDGTGNAGYTIASEAELPDARPIVRGSLFFALSVKEEDSQAVDTTTASSQFMIASAALPRINDSVTVFGRVVDSLDRVGMFRKVDLTKEEQKKDPSLQVDYLIDSQVIHKRDHDYVPTPVVGKLPY